MQKEDIAHLGKLARIAITDTEAETLAQNITDILGYISEIEEITGTASKEKNIGALYNVMRRDENPHEAGLYTEDVLALVPDRKGQYVRVKKILDKKS